MPRLETWPRLYAVEEKAHSARCQRRSSLYYFASSMRKLGLLEGEGYEISRDNLEVSRSPSSSRKFS